MVAEVQTFEGLSRIELKPLNENEIRFHLTFRSNSRTRSVQFDVSSDSAMALLQTLKGMQAKFGWQPRSRSRPRPALTVVPSSEK